MCEKLPGESEAGKLVAAGAATGAATAVSGESEEDVDEEGETETTVGRKTRKEGEKGERPYGLGTAEEVQVDVVGECGTGAWVSGAAFACAAG